jgi:hypothetical protein
MFAIEYTYDSLRLKIHNFVFCVRTLINPKNLDSLTWKFVFSFLTSHVSLPHNIMGMQLMMYTGW